MLLPRYQQLQGGREQRVATASACKRRALPGRRATGQRVTLPSSGLRQRAADSTIQLSVVAISLFLHMNDQTLSRSGTTGRAADDTWTWASYAQRAYLEYALCVVKGRALPDVCDGLKPVQRRILYAMQAMGLGYGGADGNTAAKPVKCGRVVGDVLGAFTRTATSRPTTRWCGWRRTLTSAIR